MNKDQRISHIMDMLEKFKNKYQDSNGNSFLGGGYDSYIVPENFENFAKKHSFIKHKAFDISDEQILDEVKRYLQKRKMVVIAAWTKEERIDMWLQS